MTILTMLGTGNYEPTRYEWRGESCETALFPVAVASWFPDATVKVLATEDAARKHGDSLCADVPRADLVRIPPGRSEAELWEIFNLVADALPESEPVIFDVTHGFRSLPLLTLLALSFLRIAKKVRLEAVLYGAWEAREVATNTAPVFDLTPFVRMLDWANATDRFLETGDARKIAPLITIRGRNPLKPVAERMTELSEALALMRAGLVQQKAAGLIEKIGIARGETWEPSHAPLKLLLERVEARFAPMANPSVLQSQWEQIRWLATHGHHPAAGSLAREWLVSVRLQTEGRSLTPVSNAERDAAELWLNTQRDDLRIPAEWLPAILLWRNLADLRNDLMHFGIRQSPKKPDTIVKQVRALPQQLREAVRPLGIELTP